MSKFEKSYDFEIKIVVLTFLITGARSCAVHCKRRADDPVMVFVLSLHAFVTFHISEIFPSFSGLLIDILLIDIMSRAGTVGGLQPVGIATPSNRLENFTTLNRYDDILTVVERM